VAAGEWADRGTARAVPGRDLEWGVGGDQAAGREAQAVQGAVEPAVALACGILARPAAAAAEAQARGGRAGEVAPEVGLAVAQAEELARVAREAELELVGREAEV
jgi:hypothetical protein